MSCCGQKRALLNSTLLNKKNEMVQNNEPPQNRPYPAFRYEGQIAAVFTGAITRKVYRFNFKGETRVVDYRDASAFMAEPLLKKISLP